MHKITVAGAVGAMLLGGGLARAAMVLPPVHKMGSIEYLSGGIGLDESKAIESASRQWPLTLEFAAKDRQRADFMADVKVRVRDARGHDALDATSDGPFLLAKLPPGSYDIDATAGGKTLHEHVVVKPHQPTKAVFVWAGDVRLS
jgi:hypothetical protein